VRHQVRRVTQPVVDALSAQARARPVRHGDETGGREAAQHGDVWSLSTADAHRVRADD
jgi:hypothetical protein